MVDDTVQRTHPIGVDTLGSPTLSRRWLDATTTRETAKVTDGVISSSTSTPAPLDRVLDLTGLTDSLDLTDGQGRATAPGGESPVHLEVLDDLGPSGASAWAPRYIATLVALDATAFALAGLCALSVRFGHDLPTVAVTNGGNYLLMLALALPFWVLSLAARRAYEPSVLGMGAQEFQRVGNACLLFTAALAVVCVATNVQPARLAAAIALPMAVLLTIVFRYLTRLLLNQRRRRGHATHRVLVVGEGEALATLRSALTRSTHAGLKVVCATGPVVAPNGEMTLAHVPDLLSRVGADTIAVAHSGAVTPEALRQLSWALEGRRVNLLLAPALTDVAGPRVQVRPVNGLPLLQVAQPHFTGSRRAFKRCLDVCGSALLLLVGSPVLLLLALAVRLTDGGPALFRQQRIGIDGRPFTMYKLRSMVLDAESRLAEVLAFNDHGDEHVLFKAAADPRITGVGRLLRRYSLDELPQLINVLLGQMSLVGPRPPLPSEVAQYADHVHRRLLVKPGLTGLWQVSGRADLDWQESVRLDLYYVENWSPALDFEILWRTGRAVLTGDGAR